MHVECNHSALTSIKCLRSPCTKKATILMAGDSAGATAAGLPKKDQICEKSLRTVLSHYLGQEHANGVGSATEWACGYAATRQFANGVKPFSWAKNKPTA